ncbi:hypothetical protein BCR39DRAFT_524518 [Naematelia encephala]|uniref:NTF2 domain-containing protein n=1 Tax=Naematelia encephala TaxID=71784 RepID=A0A1Y2BBI4_9TREE|nr:hypothetical protein BCR39DRAFT_524518 [Naematelia encephala]
MASLVPQTPSLPSGKPPLPWSVNAVDAASHGSIAFCQIYYETYDEPSRRVRDIPLLYLPQATIIWNGNRISSDRDKLSQFLEAMPLSRHDPQTLDCHPVAALDPTSGPAPDLIINITGSVLHGPSVAAAYDSRGPNVSPQDMPRKYHEVFILRAAEQEEDMQPKYAIHSSTFRFVG